jgi:putative ABC transport system permease protein
LPLNHHESVTFVEVEGRTLPPNSIADSRAATGGYWQAMGIRLLEGRYLTDADIPMQPPVAMISRRFRDVYFSGQDPLGRHVRFGGDPNTVWSTVVGVVEDVRHTDLESTPRPVAYFPMWRQPGGSANVVMETAVPGAGARELQTLVRGLDSTVAVSDIRTMDTFVAEAAAPRRFQAALVAAFAGLALFLAAIGVYGLMSYTVRQRTAEIGIRIAVGASRGRVIALVLRRGMLLAAVGSLAGIGGAFAATGLLRSWLYGVTATDAVTFAAVPLVLLAVAAAACLIPAWRASRIDPARALFL